MVLQVFLPKQSEFFDLFIQSAVEISSATSAFKLMFQDPSQASMYAKQIKEHEMNSDRIARYSYETADQAFMTPFDQEHMNRLIMNLENLADLVHHASSRVCLYRIQSYPQDMVQIPDFCAQSGICLVKVFQDFSDFKKKKASLVHLSHQMHDIERGCNQAFLLCIEKIFEEESDMKRLIKLKEITEHCREIVGQCKSLVSLALTLVLEYS